MTPADPAKQNAARLAADLVRPGMAVGLGSGTTATLMIQRLGQRVKDEGLEFLGVPTSRASADLAASVGIALVDLDAVDTLDLDLDGADEVDNLVPDDQGPRRRPAPREDRGRGGAAPGLHRRRDQARRPARAEVPRAGRGLPVRPAPHRARPAGARGRHEGPPGGRGDPSLRDRRRKPDHRLPLRARIDDPAALERT